MAGQSGIEWTDATWNPIVGCSIVSPGCTHCYAMAMAARIEVMGAATPHYAGTTKKVNGKAVWTGKVAMAPDRILTAPLSWKKPRRIFVNSMGDLFHEDIPDEWIDRVFAVMALSPQHTFQVLTKRAARMRGYMNDSAQAGRVAVLASEMQRHWGFGTCSESEWRDIVVLKNQPLPQVWLGVSAEKQHEADERIPELLRVPAAVRFLSAEPLLGVIDLGEGVENWPDQRRLDWVIAGGESGPGARPMHPDWARALRDQCLGAKIPFFFKQWGNWGSVYDRDRDDPDWRNVPQPGDWSRKRWLNLAGGQGVHGDKLHMMRNVGKKAAGRLLDGRTHDAFPEVRT